FLNTASDKLNEFVFIGGGFIGSELSAALNMKGKKVTLVFPDRLLLQKVLPTDLAEYVTEYYSAKGITVLAGSLPTSIDRVGDRIQITTKNGKLVSAEMVVAAIGLNLNIDIAAKAGLKIENGIDVNNLLQSSNPNIFAAGDVAYFPAKSLDKKMRVEHWNNAQAQGKNAGENMAGAGKPYDYLPYFYSDLFDLGFEAVGNLDSRMETFADWKEKYREGVVYYLDAGKVKGVLLWNVWDKVDAARELIDQMKTYTDPRELGKKL
ncbi:MAG: FAD-dependent oxidoreductase, partial [bacterium]